MTTIRKTISISKKDKQLQEVIKDVPSYEVSHVIRQLMYDGLKYRALVESGVVTDYGIQSLNMGNNIEKREPKATNIEPKRQEQTTKLSYIEDFNEDFEEINVKLEKIEEEDEDLEDILLNNG